MCAEREREIKNTHMKKKKKSIPIYGACDNSCLWFQSKNLQTSGSGLLVSLFFTRTSEKGVADAHAFASRQGWSLSLSLPLSLSLFPFLISLHTRQKLFNNSWNTLSSVMSSMLHLRRSFISGSSPVSTCWVETKGHSRQNCPPKHRPPPLKINWHSANISKRKIYIR